MASFTDSKERKWLLVVDAWSLKQLKQGVDFDLVLECATPGGWERFKEDYSRLVAVLYQLCEQQVKERGLSEEDFSRGLLGDGLESAIDGLQEAVYDFFPNRRQRDLLKEDAKAAKQRRETLMDLVEKKLPELHQQAIQSLEKQLDESGAKFLRTLASSDSTPAPSP